MSVSQDQEKKAQDKISQVLGTEADLFEKGKEYTGYAYCYSWVIAVHTLYTQKLMKEPRYFLY